MKLENSTPPLKLEPTPGINPGQRPSVGPSHEADSADKVFLRNDLSVDKADVSPDIRADKVGEVKSAIDDGSFKIDISKVADRMINESASLVQILMQMPGTDTEQQDPPSQQNSQEKFGAGPANDRRAGPDR